MVENTRKIRSDSGGRSDCTSVLGAWEYLTCFLAPFFNDFHIQVMVSKEPRWVPAEVIVPRNSLQQPDATVV